MVIIYQLGGIGNLLFQYASARGLAEKHGVPLKLDKTYYHQKKYEGDALTSFYNIDYYKNILESSFEIQAVEANAKEIRYFNLSIFQKVLERFKPYNKRRIFKERTNNFDADFFLTNKNVLLKGFWQSEKYFKHCEGLLRKEFSFKYTIQEKNQNLALVLKSNISVSIHIRRGDYVGHPVTSNFLGTVDLQYYIDAVTYMQMQLGGNINFYIFSDDIIWAKANLDFVGDKFFIDKTIAEKDVDEMYLMSCCLHNIIANSSFSWWAAWLNKNSSKIVIAPKKWFRDANYNADDLIPDNWIRI